MSILAATIVSIDGCLIAPIQLGAKALLSRASQVCPADKSLWQSTIINYNPELAVNINKYIRSIRNFREVQPMERHLLQYHDQVQEVIVFSDGSLAFTGFLIYFVVKEEGKKV